MNYKLHFLKPFLAFLGVLALCTSLYGCGGGAEATATTNVAPTANPGSSQNVVVGAVVSMDGSASKDSDGGSLTFKWTLIGKPNGSAASLTNATYPFIEQIAAHGVIKAMQFNPHLKNGLSVFKGHLTSAPVAKAQKLNYIAAEEASSSLYSAEICN